MDKKSLINRLYLRCSFPVLIALFLLSSGCAGTHFYNQTNHELAKKASKSFKDANLKDTITAEYTLNKETSSYLQEVVRRQLLARRNNYITFVLDKADDKKTWENVLKPEIEKRIAVLTGGVDLIKEITVDFKLIKDVQEKIEKYKSGYDINRMPNDPMLINLVSDDIVGKFSNPESTEEVKKDITNKLKEQCDKMTPLMFSYADGYLRNKSKFVKTTVNKQEGEYGTAESELGRLNKEIKELSKEKKDIKKEIGEIKNLYDKLKENYNETVDGSEGASESVGILLSAEKLINIIDKLDSELSNEEKQKLEEDNPEIRKEFDGLVVAAKVKKNKEMGKKLSDIIKKLDTPPANDKAKGERKKDKEKIVEMVEEGYKLASKKGNHVAMAKNLQLTLKKWNKYMGKAEKAGDLVNKYLGTDLQLAKYIASLEIKSDSLNELINKYVDIDSEPSASGDDEKQIQLKVARTMRTLTNLMEKTKGSPPVSALLLETEHMRLNMEFAKQQLARADLQLELLKKKREAIYIEYENLIYAKTSLDKILDGHFKGNLGNNIPKIIDQNKMDLGITLYYFSKSWTLGRIVQEDIDYKLIGLRHDRALDGSATALAQWNNLIAVPLSRIEAYHASGIKPNDIATILIQAGGFSSVAATN